MHNYRRKRLRRKTIGLVMSIDEHENFLDIKGTAVSEKTRLKDFDFLLEKFNARLSRSINGTPVSQQ